MGKSRDVGGYRALLRRSRTKEQLLQVLDHAKANPVVSPGQQEELIGLALEVGMVRGFIVLGETEIASSATKGEG